jgi:hypothetical protein
VPDEQETLKQQIIMRQVLRIGEVVTRQSADFPDDHLWEELDSLTHDIQFSLLALWGYSTMEQLMGPNERVKHHEMKTREAAEWMIEQGYLERSWNNGEEIWTITEKGKDYYSQLQEHAEEE